jgi:hypothetical protein
MNRSNRVSIDATDCTRDCFVDALRRLAWGEGSVIGLHIPADGPGCEVGELVVGDTQFRREVAPDDFIVTCNIDKTPDIAQYFVNAVDSF